jgi:lipopolysaccharide/colanic/teichoic acid biosynthesis glycosyltransferase
MAKRLFDLFFSVIGLVILLPFFFIVSMLIILDTRGGVFYFQKRVGKDNKDFNLIKFRTMVIGSDSKGLLTIGEQDSRITHTGRWLRKYKMDELPQLINIIKGEMSFVGPRPEVRKYVNLYSEVQEKVLTVKPGLTDYASLEYINENEVLSTYSDPEKTYIETIMPAKLALNLSYINERSLVKDVGIILKTISKLAG